MENLGPELCPDTVHGYWTSRPRRPGGWLGRKSSSGMVNCILFLEDVLDPFSSPPANGLLEKAAEASIRNKITKVSLNNRVPC